MAIPWNNEFEDEEQSRKNVDVEAALCETQEGGCQKYTTNDRGAESDSEGDDDGSNNDGNSCTSDSSIVTDASTSVANNRPTTHCRDRSTFWDLAKEIFGSFSAGCLAIGLDFVKHSTIFKRFPELIIFMIPLAGLLGRFCKSLANRFRLNDSMSSNINEQPSKLKFGDYWSPRFVLQFVAVLIIQAVVAFKRRLNVAEPIVVTMNLVLISGFGVFCSYVLIGIVVVVICLVSPYVWLIPVILSAQWWATIWTELSTYPFSFIIERLIENIDMQWCSWAGIVYLCFIGLFVYCLFVTMKKETARASLKEIEWIPMLTTFFTQCCTGLLLYEASRLFEDVEILYQISTTVNDYHMTYVTIDIAAILNEGDNTSISQAAPSLKKKGWWIAVTTVVKSTVVYGLILLISYLWLIKTYRLNIKILFWFYFTTTLGLVFRLFVTFYGTKLIRKRNLNLDSWTPYLNVLGDFITMIGLGIPLLLYPLAEVSLLEQL